jgi:hypothetical protein
VSTSPAPAGRQRRFTASEEKGLGKGFWVPVLLLALAATVGLFIWLLWPQPGNRVLFTAIVVGNYNDAEGLPDPAYPAWDFVELQRRLADRDLAPWQPFFADETAGTRSANGVVENAEQVNSVAEGWAVAAEAVKMGKHDTLVVYLRGHCLVDPAPPGDAVWFLAGEFACRNLTERDPKALPQGAVDLAKLLERLSQLPAGQVVVLLDSCDLAHLPGAGVLVNPVPAAVARCCDQLPAGAPLWVITSSASLQPIHVSDLRRRTLLQSAAEYAAQVNPDDKAVDSASKDGLITLDEFYDRLLRYACTVTGRRQTPLLFAAGSDQPVTPDSNRDRWSAAASIAMGQVDFDSIKTKKKAEEAARETEQANRQSARTAAAPSQPATSKAFSARSSGHGLALAAFRPGQRRETPSHPPFSPTVSLQEPAAPAPQSGTAPATTGQVPATQDPAGNPVNAPAPGPQPATGWDRFWQACDLLAARSGGAGFAPVDFAPHLWHELRASAIRISRQQRIGAVAVGESDASRMAEVIGSQLLPAINDGRPLSVGGENLADEARLLNAWSALLNGLDSANGGTAVWKDSGRLPTSSITGWGERRGLLRDQADALARLRDWLDLALKRPELAAPVRDLAQELAEQFQAPALTAEIIANPARERDPAGVSAARERTRGLLAALDLLLESELGPLRTRLEKKERLSWQDEWLLQSLRDSTLLTWVQRQSLEKLLAGLTVNDHAAEPGRNDLHVDPARVRMADLLAGIDNQNGPPEFLPGRQAWAEAINRLAGVATDWAVLATPGADKYGLNGWSAEVLGRLHRTAPQEPLPGINRPAFETWVQAHWKGLLRVQPPGDLIAGLVAPFQEDGTLYLEGNNRLTLSNDPTSERWRLPIKRADGRRLGPTFLRWTPVSAPTIPDPTVIHADQPRRAREWFDAGNLLSGEVILTIRPGGPPDDALSSQMQWEAAAAPTDDAPRSSPLLLTIDPPNPDRVELAVRWLNPPADATANPVGCALRPGETLRRLQEPLAVPAVGSGVFSRYELTLINHSSTARQVRVTLYAVDPPSGTSRFGSGDDWNPEWVPQAEDTIFVATKPVALPGAQTGGGGLSPEKVPLKLANAELSTNFHGLLCVVQDVRQEGDLWVDTGREFRFWLPCRAENPYDGKLVRLTPQPGNEELRLLGKLEQPQREQFNLKELPVALEIRDTAGMSLRTGVMRARLESGNQYEYLLAFARKDITESRWSPPAIGAVTVGEYQRAVLFSTGLQKTETAQRMATSLARIDLGSMILDEPEVAAGESRAKADPPAADESGNWIVPVWVGAAWNAPGDPLRLDRIRVPVRIDLARGGQPDLEVRLLAGPDNAVIDSLRLGTDRHFVPSWRASVNGDLEFGCAATDVEYRVENPGGLTGPCQLEVVNRRDQKTLATGRLLFDRTPPLEPEVEVPGARPVLYEDSQLIFSVTPRDEMTSVRQVWFALRGDDEREYVFDEEPLGGAQREGGVWQLTLKGENLSGRPRGEWRVVTRCVDAAGNVQDLCTPAAFDWRDQPQPVAPGGGDGG